MAAKKLTSREKEIVERVLEGKSNKAISVDLNIKPHTVTVHLQNIFPKLGVHSRYEVITRFRNTGEL